MKLLVLHLRGLQASAIGPYGNRWTETVSLDTLAANGVVFDNHFAVHPDPVLARHVWRTGRYQFQPTEEPPDLLALLAEGGVTTHLVADTSRGEFADFARGWAGVEALATTKAVLARGRELLGTAGSWLVFLDLAALLPPWKVPSAILDAYFAPDPADEDGEELEPLEPLLDPGNQPIDPDDDDLYLRGRQTYAAAISHLDEQLAGLLDGLADDVHLVVTSDAGQALGEHGVVGQPTLHAEGVHVPLLLYGPGCKAGKRLHALTGSIDLAATVAELAGGRLAGADGVSLLPWLTNAAVADRECLVLGHGADRGLRTPGWSLLLPAGGDPRLYVQPDDRWEVSDVAKQYEDDVAALTDLARRDV